MQNGTIRSWTMIETKCCDIIFSQIDHPHLQQRKEDTRKKKMGQRGRWLSFSATTLRAVHLFLSSPSSLFLYLHCTITLLTLIFLSAIASSLFELPLHFRLSPSLLCLLSSLLLLAFLIPRPSPILSQSPYIPLPSSGLPPPPPGLLSCWPGAVQRVLMAGLLMDSMCLTVDPCASPSFCSKSSVRKTQNCSFRQHGFNSIQGPDWTSRESDREREQRRQTYCLLLELCGCFPPCIDPS